MNSENKKRFGISKWIFTSIAVLLNSFLVFYSCLDDKTTQKWTYPFTNFFVNLINNFTSKEVVTIPLENININLADEASHKYNYLPGYKIEEVPLGSAKQIDCFFSPEDATNKSVSYSAQPAENVVLNQSGSTLSVVGMKTGDCVITAKSSDGGFESSVNIKVVETIAPTSYEISLVNTNAPLGTTQTINFDIDGGVLGHNELINFRYYDTRKLTYASSNETVATVDNYGVIYPVSVGDTTITVSNGDYSKSLNVSITSGSSPTPYSNLSISGSDVCCANDMILDQSSKKNHYQLTPKDGEAELNPEDFIWESSNELLVKVDKHGVMRGFRKTSLDDESAIITAKSKTTGQSATFNVTVKNQLPTSFSVWFVIADKEVWNPDEYTLVVGEEIIVRLSYSPSTQTKDVVVVSSDEEVISFTNEGSNIVLHILSEGSSTLTFTSVINPDLSRTIRFDTTKAGAIAQEDIKNVGTTIRKSLGHAFIFMVTQIFTFLAFYTFYYEREWYVYTSMSLGEGLFISGLTELIQYFVPSRGGAWLDVLIDFSGVVVGAALALLGIFIVKKIIAKRRAKQVESK